MRKRKSRYLISVGPDVLAVHYKSKPAAIQAIHRAMPRRVPLRQDHVGYTFRGRRYCYAELADAQVFTLDEYFEALR